MNAEQLVERLGGGRQRGAEWSCRCPAHEDNTASLTVKDGRDGRVLVRCHAGCTFKDIVAGAGLKPADLMPPRDDRPQRKQIVAAYDYRGADGTLLFQAVRFQPKDFRQRKPDGTGGWAWKLNGVQRVPYRLPELLAADPAEIVHVVEGEKDVDRLRDLGMVATCNVGGAGKWRREYSEHLRGRRVVVLADNDDPGREHAQQVAQSLSGVAESVRVVELPGLPQKGDVSDWLDGGGTADQLRDLIGAAPDWSGEPKKRPARDHHDDDSGLPTIFLGHDEADIAVEVQGLLGKADLPDERRLYQRGGQLAEVVRVKTPAGLMPQVRSLPPAMLRERITAACRFQSRNRDGHLVNARPPKWLIDAIAQRGEYGLPVLAGIVRCPTLRPDGTVLQSLGYDSVTGLIYLPDGEFPAVPDQPTARDAQKAAAELLDVVGDFPFASEVYRASWLAMVLTLVGRAAIDGPCPLFAIDANTRGSGKSLSADVASVIAFGAAVARKSWTPDDDETRKLITSVALEATPAVLLDNVARKIGNASLDAALTATTWTDRILGRSETTGVLPLRAIWVATGNNLILGADCARRTLYCRLETAEEHPEDRVGFKHPDLLGWTRANRRRLAVAAVTILRAWFAAGRPDQKLPPWGSYEAWSAVVRGAIVHAGLPDPAEGRVAVRDADASAEQLQTIIAAIEAADPTGEGMLAGDIIAKAESDAGLRALVADLCPRNPTARAVGYALRKHAGRVCGGKRLECRRTKTGRFWLIQGPQIAKPGVDMTDGVDHSPPSHACGRARAHAYVSRPGDSSAPSITSTPAELVHCPGCGAPMEGAEPVGGWRNWDCPGCGAVVPRRLDAEEVGR